MYTKKATVQLQKKTQQLVSANLMKEGDTLLDYFQCSCKSFFQWEKGEASFTEERLIQLVGVTGFTHYVIPYHTIKKVEKSTQFFLPLALKITYEDSNGKLKTLKVSMMKRDFWLEFLTAKAEVASRLHQTTTSA